MEPNGEGCSSGHQNGEESLRLYREMRYQHAVNGNASNLVSPGDQSDEDFPNYSPTTNTPLQFQNQEKTVLLNNCWLAGARAAKEKGYMIFGRKLNENDILLQRVFLHGFHAKASRGKDSNSGLLAQCLSAGIMGKKKK